jgi:hypothetical protein
MVTKGDALQRCCVPIVPHLLGSSALLLTLA